jgi:hypothetical protein
MLHEIDPVAPGDKVTMGKGCQWLVGGEVGLGEGGGSRKQNPSDQSSQFMPWISYMMNHIFKKLLENL